MLILRSLSAKVQEEHLFRGEFDRQRENRNFLLLTGKL